MKNIVIVGIDGAGKSTLAEGLKEKLTLNYDKRIEILRSNKINSSIYSKVCEKFNIAEMEEIKASAFYWDLLMLYWQTSGKMIDYCIWDRYFYCLEAYFAAQKIYMNEWLEIVNSLPEPDLIIYCQIEPRKAIDRISERGNVKPLENEEYLSKVCVEYERIFKDKDILFINAENSVSQNTEIIISKLRENNL